MLNFPAIIRKHKSIIAYLFFGACTTLVNIVMYALCYKVCGIQNVASTAIAWIASVLFAYITNKVWVFESRRFALKVLLRELASFFLARILTGILDLAIMYLTVDRMQWNALLWKVIANVIVVILNYIASKYLIFMKKPLPANTTAENHTEEAAHVTP